MAKTVNKSNKSSVSSVSSDVGIDVKIKQILKKEQIDLQTSELVLNFSGKSVTPELVNTVRRLTLDHVPMYAFHRNNIYIEKNTSIFNNDQMKLHLSQIIIPNLVNNIYYLDQEYWDQVDFSNPNRKKHPQDTRLLEMYIHGENKTVENIDITTNNSKIFEDGIQLPNKFNEKYPRLIIQLRPGEIFSCRRVASLAIGKLNNIWSATRNAYYSYESEDINGDINGDPKEIIFHIHSHNQMDEYEILYKSCLVLKIKLENIKNNITETFKKPEYKNINKITIILENEDHTIANLLNTYLQLNKNVVFCGLSKPNLLIDRMVIKLEVNHDDPLKEILLTIEHIDAIFESIKEQIHMLGKKFITFNINENKKSKK